MTEEEMKKFIFSYIKIITNDNVTYIGNLTRLGSMYLLYDFVTKKEVIFTNDFLSDIKLIEQIQI